MPPLVHAAIDPLIIDPLVHAAGACPAQVRPGVVLAMHHSRDTALKQWSETRVLTLSGLGRLLRTAIAGGRPGLAQQLRVVPPGGGEEQGGGRGGGRQPAGRPADRPAASQLQQEQWQQQEAAMVAVCCLCCIFLLRFAVFESRRSGPLSRHGLLAVPIRVVWRGGGRISN